MDAVDLARVGSEGAADLGAGGVAVGVQDAGEGVGAFAGFEEPAVARVEGCAPGDEFGHAQGAFLHEDFGGAPVDEAVAGVDGVFEVEGDVGLALGGDGDAALRVVGVRFAQRFFGHDEDFAVLRQFDGGAEACDASAHHQEINILR